MLAYSLASGGRLSRRSVLGRVASWRRSFADPLRNPKAAARWIAGLSATDALQLQHEALDLVTSFAGSRRAIGPAQAEALLAIDARFEPVVADLTAQYTANYHRSSSVETRLWHAVFDLVKAFVVAYEAVVKSGYGGREDRQWKATLPRVLARLAHYKGLDGKFRLFRYGHWIPAQWREYHELYEFARTRGWHHESTLAGSGFHRPAMSQEQEYVATLLLLRLDSGSFTPDQVEWVARALDGWVGAVKLSPQHGTGANFLVDLSGTHGLRRGDRPRAGGRVLYLDAAPVYSKIVERMRVLPDQDDVPPPPGELPAREQKLLLMRLAALYGPDALAYAPRAPRQKSEHDVRVVVGLQALTRAVAEVERLSRHAKSIGAMMSYDEITQMVNPSANPDSVARRVRGSQWRLVDHSDSGCRLVAPAKDAPAKLGEIIAFHLPEGWSLAVVRRMQREQVDEVICGVEVIARRIVRVLLRVWVAPLDADRASIDRPFFGIYIPAHAANRQAAQRSLVGPDDRLLQGGMVELDTGNARYLVRFTQTIERQAGWSWGMFSAVRKLPV
ncbi:MAG TPA: hypothetical protein VJQ49_03590 [Casimicrobiaceae bacterium]|nr:hypothetical protein [Casimicrobiaceae bacterium]